MANRIKPILLLLGLIVLFFLVAPYLLQAVFAIIKKPSTSIRYAEAVQGRITSVEIERQFHMYYLDNDTKRWYSFNAFLPPLTPAQRQQLSQDELFYLTLGRKLKVGDYVSKQANSTMITVQRGESTSRYFCATPQEREEAQK
jgi:hypothetical protein